MSLRRHLNLLLQHRAFAQRPNKLFKGTPTTLASLRKCQAGRPLTPALGFHNTHNHRAHKHMEATLKALIEKIPVKFTLVVLSVVIAWFGILTGVALFTKRSVDFFPPRISTDPALVAELKALSEQVRRLSENEQAHRARMLAMLERTRDKSLQMSQLLSVGMTDAEANVQKMESALSDEDQKFLQKIEKIESQIQKLSGEFK